MYIFTGMQTHVCTHHTCAQTKTRISCLGEESGWGQATRLGPEIWHWLGFPAPNPIEVFIDTSEFTSKLKIFSSSPFYCSTAKWVFLLSRILSSLRVLPRPPPRKSCWIASFFLPIAHSYSRSGIDFWYYPFCLSQIVLHFPLRIAEISPTNDYSYHCSQRFAWGREFSRS